ncbi:hypothetical protein PYH37_005261 [Sinorhizobium numidicum]|uniref:Uncharacterized protein n=1 Tax=Sinorhizobium numidicum TaxID=680248 RepID=A0ABY8CY42_9HYPH|nr:hypothetical protein [Sinorhizobium numidicum]WEX76910.1 hypothetical protein PYH37_005261 [Sinorhizobium numidicum]WEX83569.1 hypothetical protein PYH38_002354 [Sinorhizobium numidicum]
MTAQLAITSNPNTHAREAFLAFVRALAVRQARLDAMMSSAANDNRPS